MVFVPLPRLYLEYKAHEYQKFRASAYGSYVSHRQHLVVAWANGAFLTILWLALEEKHEITGITKWLRSIAEILS
jgi:hypothetical protein